MANTVRISDLDFVFISYREPNADENYADLLNIVPWAKRVHGVRGFDNAHKAAAELAEIGVFLEVIDVQTLLPFDTQGIIGTSIQKTNRVLFADEDVPGGGTAFMMQQVLDNQSVYSYLDAAPQNLAAQAHRPAYSTDGDYFSKPSVEDVVEKVYQIMHESNPKKYPAL